MELLDVTLTNIQRRNRAAFVRRSDVPDQAELPPGHKVVLRDEDGEFFAGTVIEAQGDRFLVHLGVRLPEEYAMLRLGRVPRQARSDEELQDVLELLGEARAVAGAVPGQRRARSS